MTTTTTFSGMDPSGRSSSRVLRPPGGGSNFSLGFDEPAEQPVRRNKMASSIFGTPEENPPSWAKPSGAKPGEIREDSEFSGPQRSSSTEANYGDTVDPKGGDVGGEASGIAVRTANFLMGGADQYFLSVTFSNQKLGKITKPLAAPVLKRLLLGGLEFPRMVLTPLQW
ncbi:jupiter microtubule associated homolog 1 isoform X1 [Cuculus canorus]|uniref:jupiter microtubule associated homolog 1 isoform X1 n=1 Tax=Cuculus canorus TaxID=55661 RepID=UPI0023AB0ED0|nr:jupiter microtubule associated homolog 1 isoform X1 [Cuculus canorus]